MKGHNLIGSEAATRDVIQKNSSKNFRNIHRKTPVLESLFNKVAGLQTCNSFKKDSNTSVFL